MTGPELTHPELTYPEHGATRGVLPRGYRYTRIREPIGRGVFEPAAKALLTWRMHRLAGLRVAAPDPEVHPGDVVRVRAGLGPIGITAPCRVVYVVDEPNRRGFGYGTLPGHPETGEEAFLVERDPDGLVWLRVTAFWRPASRLARLGGPLTRIAQAVATRRYVRGLRRCVQPDA